MSIGACRYAPGRLAIPVTIKATISIAILLPAKKLTMYPAMPTALQRMTTLPTLIFLIIFGKANIKTSIRMVMACSLLYWPISPTINLK